MSSWPMVALAEVFEVARGGSPRPIDSFITDDPNGVNWIMIGDASEGSKYISSTKKRIIKEGVKKSRMVKAGDFLLTNSMSFGKPYILKTSGCIHDGWLVLSPRHDQVHPDFFYHLLGSDVVYSKFKTLAAGAVVKNLNSELVRGVEIPLPPLAEQKRIAAILDKADAIRRKRQEALRLTDEFLRSVFLDMFGDPVTNPKGWKFAPLGKICDVRDGTHDSPSYVEQGFPLLTSKNFKDGKIDFSGANFISESDYEQINRRSKVHRGDLVMPMIGTIGNPVLIDEEPRFAIKNVALIKFGPPSPNNIYLRELLCSHYFDFATRSCNRGGTQKFVALNDLRSIPVPLPPEPLQLKFAEIAQKTKLTREAMTQDPGGFTLFFSLQQRAFRGEL